MTERETTCANCLGSGRVQAAVFTGQRICPICSGNGKAKSASSANAVPLSKLKEEMKYLREVEQQVGRLAKENSDLRQRLASPTAVGVLAKYQEQSAENVRDSIPKALETIDALAMFAANHGCFTEPVRELIAVTDWLRCFAQYDTTGEKK